jgi:hypothetical protein
MIAKIIKALIVAAVLALVVQSLPEVKRYLASREVTAGDSESTP